MCMASIEGRARPGYVGCMVTRLRNQLRREIRVGGVAYVVSITDEGLKLVERARRKGHELLWKDLVSGDAALAVALNASMEMAPAPRQSGKRTGAERRPRPRAARRR